MVFCKTKLFDKKGAYIYMYIELEEAFHWWQSPSSKKI